MKATAPRPPCQPQRRELLAALGFWSALSLQPAHALDFSLPKLEDLREKWATVGIGSTPEIVLQVMGSPNGRTETQTMGVAHLNLEWKDIRGFRYAARFLAGRLYAKEMSDTR